MRSLINTQQATAPVYDLDTLFAIENYVGKVKAIVRDNALNNLNVKHLHQDIHILVRLHKLMILSGIGDKIQYTDNRVERLVAMLGSIRPNLEAGESSGYHLGGSIFREILLSLKGYVESLTHGQEVGQVARIQRMQLVARMVSDEICQNVGVEYRYVFLSLWNDLTFALGAGFEDYAPPPMAGPQSQSTLFASGRQVIVNGELLKAVAPGQLMTAELPVAIFTLMGLIMNDAKIKDKEAAIIQHLDHWMSMRLAQAISAIETRNEEKRAQTQAGHEAAIVPSAASEEQSVETHEGVPEHDAKAHWLSDRDAPVVNPPLRMGVGIERNLLEHNVTNALQQAFRLAADYGNVPPHQFNPDIFMARAMLTLFGPYTKDGNSTVEPQELQATIVEPQPHDEEPLSLDEQRLLAEQEEAGLTDTAVAEVEEAEAGESDALEGLDSVEQLDNKIVEAVWEYVDADAQQNDEFRRAIEDAVKRQRQDWFSSDNAYLTALSLNLEDKSIFIHALAGVVLNVLRHPEPDTDLSLAQQLDGEALWSLNEINTFEQEIRLAWKEQGLPGNDWAESVCTSVLCYLLLELMAETGDGLKYVGNGKLKELAEKIDKEDADHWTAIEQVIGNQRVGGESLEPVTQEEEQDQRLVPDAEERAAEEPAEASEEVSEVPEDIGPNNAEELAPTAPMNFDYLGDFRQIEEEISVVSVVPYNEVEIAKDYDEFTQDQLIGFEMIDRNGVVLNQVHVSNEKGLDVVNIRRSDDGVILSMTPKGTWMNVAEDLRNVIRLKAYFMEN